MKRKDCLYLVYSHASEVAGVPKADSQKPVNYYYIHYLFGHDKLYDEDEIYKYIGKKNSMTRPIGPLKGVEELQEVGIHISNDIGGVSVYFIPLEDYNSHLLSMKSKDDFFKELRNLGKKLGKRLDHQVEKNPTGFFDRLFS